MISASDFRNGKTFEMDGKVYQILEFLHVKPGKGAAFVRTKLKDVVNGGVVERTFRPEEKFEEAFIERKMMEYSYEDGAFYYFMDMETFDMVPVAMDDARESMKFVKANETVTLSFYKGSVFLVEPPLNVVLAITETEPGVKGNTATNVTKPAIVETGAQVNVPIFVEEGTMIKIDTRTGEYLSRV